MTGRFVAVAAETLEVLSRHPESVSDQFFPDRDDTEWHLDIDKTWHAIHYLLTGCAWGGDWPLSAAILGGTEIGEDGGYGKPRYLTPDEVATVAKGLGTVLPGALAARYDPARLNALGIYPGGWSTARETITRLRTAFDELTAFYSRAAAAGRAVLLGLY